MDMREGIKRCLAVLVQLADEADSQEIKEDIALLQGTMSQLITKLTERNAALAKQCRSRHSKPPKSAPAKSPQQRKQPASSTDTPSAQKDAEDRSKELSSIQQGIRQADPSLADQQRALRGKIYGAQNDEVAFRKAAQAIAR